MNFVAMESKSDSSGPLSIQQFARVQPALMLCLAPLKIDPVGGNTER